MIKRNDKGYLEDNTLVEVVTKQGRMGVMPAWLAEVSEKAGVVVIRKVSDAADEMRLMNLMSGTGE